jgi:hypothetical protein
MTEKECLDFLSKRCAEGASPYEALCELSDEASRRGDDWTALKASQASLDVIRPLSFAMGTFA